VNGRFVLGKCAFGLPLDLVKWFAATAIQHQQIADFYKMPIYIYAHAHNKLKTPSKPSICSPHFTEAGNL
jgi:hypothetical protein